MRYRTVAALLVALSFAANCSDTVKKPKAFLVVTFDTEDYVTPESEGIDDIPKWLAETMTEEGVTGRPQLVAALGALGAGTNERRIAAEIEGYKTWPVHRPDLGMSRVVELTRLQL
jgi:hypothetical protein